MFSKLHVPCQVKSSQVAFNMIVASALSYKRNKIPCNMYQIEYPIKTVSKTNKAE